MSDDEDDWFERALRELEDSPTDSEEPGGPEGEGTESDDGGANEDGPSADEVDGLADGNDVSAGEDDDVDGPLPTDNTTDPVDPDDRAVPDPEDDPFGGVQRSSAAAADDTGNVDGVNDLLDATGTSDATEATPDDAAKVAGSVDSAPNTDADGHEDDVDGDPPGSGSNGDPFGGGSDPGIGEDGDPFGGGSDPGIGEDGDPFGGGSDPGIGEDGDPFGGEGGDPLDGGSDGPLGGSGEEEGFGFADFDGPSGDAGSPFDGAEAEFDSDIDRIDIGIDGLDEMILGGVPSRSLMSVIGSAGTGKTTFALQFLNEGLEAGEKAVYLTLEQSREAMHDTAEEKGWPFREYTANDQLAIVAMDPIEMANSLTSIRNDFSRLIADFGAERLVLDSVSLLEMMYDRPAQRRSEVFDFTRSLKESGVTTLLTSEASEENPYASRYGIVEYLTDAVFVLQYIRGSDFRETRLAVEIQKIRDANHSRETKPYEISNSGISVYRQANIF